MKHKPLGIIIGSILAIAAVVSIFFLDLKTVPEEPPPPVRPIKSIIAGEAKGPLVKKYPGKVGAADTANLSFLVSGTLTDKLVKKGDRVTMGQELAKLDPRDFQSALDGANAQVAQARAEFNRVQKLFVSNNASKSDLDAAEAASKIAASELERAQKAIEDTVLKAEFDGIIADSFPDRGENVTAGQAVYRLQSADSRMKIDIQVPEGHIARTDIVKASETVRATASFDFLPDEEGISLSLKEFESIADPATQTYAVSFWMDAPEGVRILPGMTATVTVITDPVGEAADAIVVPLAAVPTDGVGQYFVWKLNQNDGDQLFSVARTNVSVGNILDDQIEITSGLAKGDRIAAAGARVLTDNQVVRLLDQQ